jgi:predicted nucleic acid-binding protein
VSFVLDSSVALSWCFKDEQTPQTLETLRMAKTRAIFVPSIWHVEVSNVLGIAYRKGRLNDADLAIALTTFETLEIHTDIPLIPIGPVELLPLMRIYELTAYDALYLELATRLSLPLATLDAKLLSAAKQAGISLLGDWT